MRNRRRSPPPKAPQNHFVAPVKKVFKTPDPCWRCGCKIAPFGYGFPILEKALQFLWLCTVCRKRMLENVAPGEQAGALRQVYEARLRVSQ